MRQTNNRHPIPFNHLHDEAYLCEISILRLYTDLDCPHMRHEEPVITSVFIRDFGTAAA